MKTIKQIITKKIPQLEITYDEWGESPREWDNLGNFITKEIKYNSPDGTDSAFYDTMIEVSRKAENGKDHADRILKEHNNIKYIFVISKYDHGGVVYSVGKKHGWDTGVSGFYIITEEDLKRNGTPKMTEAVALQQVAAEVETYTQWANGEVYKIVLYDENGDMEDSCGGFYDIEDIRDYLPEEWNNEDLNDYMQY